jgi:hypothetical protein
MLPFDVLSLSRPFGHASRELASLRRKQRTRELNVRHSADFPGGNLFYPGHFTMELIDPLMPGAMATAGNCF